jgi:hypothetical protein
MGNLPVQTREQLADALAKAHAARTARSEALAALKSGSVTLAGILADKDSPLQRAFVRQVLRALPGVGTVTADAAMAEAGIAPKRRISGLGANQARALAERFATADA